ncbi:cytochrome c maturation protein CcmE [Hydrocarboniclastica marina]|uniref:Cytochrome c-type biogenesis protein CcmE n=1 Tax=Hydrocarboniclastica marina TaxID=2259620 RepID=A0A4P7XG72_9ALTE|nr:cytochrome c maturation protein CcmE [Hydrocarboniclastica marina]MAL98544.1 cytochrome c maturation protein CcmE [Alteromonadaceae bacterium]QCF25705.1 cytochrome c maturation protein CcmE [Hydrocarboniclastica marina]
MNPTRKRRLILVLFLLAGVSVAIGLIMTALRDNINLFYDPTQIAEGEAPQNVRIRAGGMVEEGSVSRADDSLDVSFRITDRQSSVEVRYEGILPDLFREGQGVVAMGRMAPEGYLRADEVLAKHDENYMPPEVAEAMENAKMRMRDTVEGNPEDTTRGADSAL